jgi:hypothetical protein
MKRRQGLRCRIFRSSRFVDVPFSCAISLSDRASRLFALVILKGIALVSIIGLGLPGSALR